MGRGGDGGGDDTGPLPPGACSGGVASRQAYKDGACTHLHVRIAAAAPAQAPDSHARRGAAATSGGTCCDSTGASADGGAVTARSPVLFDGYWHARRWHTRGHSHHPRRPSCTNGTTAGIRTGTGTLSGRTRARARAGFR